MIDIDGYLLDPDILMETIIRIAVLGTGLAGLLSAIFLRKVGASVRLIGPSPQESKADCPALIHPNQHWYWQILGLSKYLSGNAATLNRLTCKQNRKIWLDHQFEAPLLAISSAELRAQLLDRALFAGVEHSALIDPNQIITKQKGREVHLEGAGEASEISYGLVIDARNHNPAQEKENRPQIEKSKKVKAWGLISLPLLVESRSEFEEIELRADQEFLRMLIIPFSGGKDPLTTSSIPSSALQKKICVYYAAKSGHLDRLKKAGSEAILGPLHRIFSETVSDLAWIGEPTIIRLTECDRQKKRESARILDIGATSLRGNMVPGGSLTFILEEAYNMAFCLLDSGCTDLSLKWWHKQSKKRRYRMTNASNIIYDAIFKEGYFEKSVSRTKVALSAQNPATSRYVFNTDLQINTRKLDDAETENKNLTLKNWRYENF